MARGRGRAETSPKVTPRFCSLRSHGAFLSIVLFPTSEVQLCFKSPTEPEALPPPALAFIDFTWHADVALQKEVLCCGPYQEGEREPVSAAASGPSARESNSLGFREQSRCVGKRDILLPMVVGYTHQSDGMEELWNSFLYDQILLKIRKTSGNQGIQAYSQISPFNRARPPWCSEAYEISAQQNASSPLPLPLSLCDV